MTLEVLCALRYGESYEERLTWDLLAPILMPYSTVQALASVSRPVCVFCVEGGGRVACDAQMVLVKDTHCIGMI